jgi:hypothetical protein
MRPHRIHSRLGILIQLAHQHGGRRRRHHVRLRRNDGWRHDNRNDTPNGRTDEGW